MKNVCKFSESKKSNWTDNYYEKSKKIIAPKASDVPLPI